MIIIICFEKLFLSCMNCSPKPDLTCFSWYELTYMQVEYGKGLYNIILEYKM